MSVKVLKHCITEDTKHDFPKLNSPDKNSVENDAMVLVLIENHQ